MSAIWEELWHSMPQSGKISVTVNSLLQQYKERCRAERKRPRDSDEGPPALLPVSFAQAKDWLLKQQKALSEALETGAVNEKAREVVADLSRSLAEQSTSTAALLEQPARPASPVIPPPVMSLGPEAVTDDMRAEERARERAHRQEEQPSCSSKKKAAPKKGKAVPPELEERQKRASARMEELGVHPLEARINNYLYYNTIHCLIFLSTYKTFLCSLFIHMLLIFFQEKVPDGKRRCPACNQLRTASDKTPDGQIHRVLGRSNKIWCPYADDRSILETFEKEHTEKMQAAWRRANEAKRLKKKQLSETS